MFEWGVESERKCGNRSTKGGGPYGGVGEGLGQETSLVVGHSETRILF